MLHVQLKTHFRYLVLQCGRHRREDYAEKMHNSSRGALEDDFSLVEGGGSWRHKPVQKCLYSRPNLWRASVPSRKRQLYKETCSQSCSNQTLSIRSADRHHHGRVNSTTVSSLRARLSSNVPTLDHSAPHSSLLSGKFWNIFPRYKVQSPSSYSMACRLLVTRRGTVSVIESQIRHLSPDAISSFPWQSSRLITWDKGFYGSELSKPWHHLNLHFRFTKSFVHDEWVWVPGLCVDPEQKTPWRRLYPTN